MSITERSLQYPFNTTLRIDAMQRTNVLPKILLVEDDVELAELTRDYLQQHQYEVDIVSDGKIAIARITETQPDVLILDLNLPSVDGIEVCKQVRHHFNNPILMLTARTESFDHILGLEIGADDYLAKPVEPRLLVAHVNALLRRDKRQETTQCHRRLIQVKNLVINDSARIVTFNNETVPMSGCEYELLLLLASHVGNILTREFIFGNLRGIGYDGNNRAIDTNISRLRTKLGDPSNDSTIIKTIRNKGYLLSN